jgi:hypothetical protein
MTVLSELYQQDYLAWSKRTAELLKAGNFADLDLANLVKELEGMGVSEQHELENRLVVLIAHLLKWQFPYQQLSERWREFDGRSWRSTIIEQRTRIAKRLRQAPGLKAILTATIAEAYQDAVELASKETQLPPSTFPSECPYSTAQLFDEAFYP